VDAERRSATEIWDIPAIMLIRQAEQKRDFMSDTLRQCGLLFGKGMLPNPLASDNCAGWLPGSGFLW
jgi:hypothetical protein